MLAATLDDIQRVGLPGFKFTDTQGGIGSIITTILKDYVFYFAGVILLIYLIMGGLQLMLSRGDPKAMQSAQAKITNALIGFVIIFFAYIIVKLVGQIFGIEIFSSIFG